MKKLLFSAISLTFLLSACGGSGAQGDVADLLLETAAEEGLGLNEDCVRETSAKLSDADAQAIVDAGVDGDADLSAEGDALGDEIFSSCVDLASYIDLVVTAFADDDDTMDADCLRGQFEGLNTVDEVDDKLFSAAFACTTE